MLLKRVCTEVHMQSANSLMFMFLILCRYRKIAGDVCEGGDERLYAPYQAECCRTPTEPPTQSTHILLLEFCMVYFVCLAATTTSSASTSKFLHLHLRTFGACINSPLHFQQARATPQPPLVLVLLQVSEACF